MRKKKNEDQTRILTERLRIKCFQRRDLVSINRLDLKNLKRLFSDCGEKE